MSKREILKKLSTIRHAERGIAPQTEWVSRTRAYVVDCVQKDLASGVVFRKPSVVTARPEFVTRIAQWMRAPALITASIITTVFGGSLLGVSASDRSVPGDFLYPIKLASEQTRLALTSDKVDRLRLKTEFVGRRVDEIKTISASPDASSSDRVRQAAQVLKRDLDTVKNQLQEVKQDTPGAKAVEVAKMVDEKTDSVASELKFVKENAPEDVKPSLAEAEVAAIHTGVSAVEVMIDANGSQDGQTVISDADVAHAIQNKVDGIQATLNGAAGLLLLPGSDATGTVSALSHLQSASSSALQITNASATLQEVRNLLGENKLNEVTGKLFEAAKTAFQAETDASLASVSSTAAAPVTTTSSSEPIIPVSSTSSVSAPASSSTQTSSTRLTPP
ncbi:MAG: DUF5667 domain-containing protein [Candidatus Uhrbacteria bacterium]